MVYAAVANLRHLVRPTKLLGLNMQGRRKEIFLGGLTTIGGLGLREVWNSVAGGSGVLPRTTFVNIKNQIMHYF